jgi:4-aminobutyrate aminotransferase/(S)-3-amino-2-methylpropionate transaminase
MGVIVRRTALPGPRSQAILSRKEAVVPNALSVYTPFVVEKAEGAVVHDVDGNSFIDMSGGIGCLNVGHAAEAVRAAIAAQAGRFTHTDFTVIPYEGYVGLAERLVSLVPGHGPRKAAFFNSGAEAVENAVKFARAFTRRQALIAFTGGFHGRTLLTMSLTSKVHPYKAGLGPFAPGVHRAPYAYCYRCPLGLEHPRCELACAAAVEQMFVTTVAEEEVAALVVEPIQGEGGFIVPPAGFLQRLEAICRQRGIVFVADEVQTGYGRTGRFFACEHAGLDPDLVVVAKSMAAGMPLSGVIGRAAIMDAPPDSAIGGTYVGNPVALAAAHAVLDEIANRQLLAAAERIGATIRARFRDMQDRYSAIGDVRGVGAMMALELVQDRQSRTPAPELTARILRRAVEGGAIYLRAGLYGNVIRVLVPLVISPAELDEALGVLDEAFAVECGRG